jgi:hypothetical protein
LIVGRRYSTRKNRNVEAEADVGAEVKEVLRLGTSSSAARFLRKKIKLSKPT